jgi:hypothetical protein
MTKNYQVSVLDGHEIGQATVLKVASAARNSVSQFYTQRVQVSSTSLASLNAKIADKLRLHRVDRDELHLTFSIQFANDKTLTFDSPQSLTGPDLEVPALTQLITAKWTFICDVDGQGMPQSHSIYVRISERPNPALILQKVMSGHSEDLESLDNEAFAPIACKIDFIDGRFSSELLSVVSEWVESLPKAQATFGFVRWLQQHEDRITHFVHGVLPSIAILGYSGLWLSQPLEQSATSIRLAVVWILGGAVVYEAVKYIARLLNNTFLKQLRRINTVPVFQITAGDRNKQTEYLARSHRSMFKLGLTGIFYGAAKAVGLYFASKLFQLLI